MKKVKLSAKGRADLDAIFLYIAERDGIEAADRRIDRLVETFTLLAVYHPWASGVKMCSPTATFFRLDRTSVFIGGVGSTWRFPESCMALETCGISDALAIVPGGTASAEASKAFGDIEDRAGCKSPPQPGR